MIITKLPFSDPNPPRNININNTTTDSIFTEWAPALLMNESDGFNYTVSISNSSWSKEYNTKDTFQNLTDLKSGTSHDISVRTTGPFHLQSESIQLKNVGTSRCSFPIYFFLNHAKFLGTSLKMVGFTVPFTKLYSFNTTIQLILVKRALCRFLSKMFQQSHK